MGVLKTTQNFFSCQLLELKDFVKKVIILNNKNAQTSFGKEQSMPKRFFLLTSILIPFALASCRFDHADPSIQKALELHTIVKGAEYVGSGTCEMCHDKEVRDFKLATHAKIEIKGEFKGDAIAVEGCEVCHGPGSVHVDESGGKKNIINPNKNPDICYACHLDKKAEFNLPYHHPVPEGHVTCADCHSLHGPEAKPWTATSLDGINERCFKCHKDQRGPFVFQHEAMREGCTVCHKVHGSIHDKLLKVRDSNLCLQCHTQNNFPTIGSNGHGGSTRLPAGPCFSGGCHRAVHGSNFDDHLRS